MIDVIITAILISSIIFLFFKNMRLKFQNTDLLNSILKIQLEKVSIKNKLDDLLINDDKDASDGFIKFISESREQAFIYIEESQELLKEFSIFMSKNLDHLKSNTEKDIKYRIIIKDLEEYYEKIKNLLPKEA